MYTQETSITSYQVGQWTGENWIARVFTLKAVPKRAPCDTLLYLWPKQEWIWANTVTVKEAATRLPAISVDTDGVRARLTELLLDYGKPAWVAREVGVSRAAVNYIQNSRNLDRWAYLLSVEQIRADIDNGMKIRDMCATYGIGLRALHVYLAAQGVSYQEMVRERDDRLRALGLPSKRRSRSDKKSATSQVAADHGISTQQEPSATIPAGHKLR